MKRWMSKGIAMVLSITMALGLGACGKEKTQSVDGEISKQNVYSSQVIELPQEGDSLNVETALYYNDRVYMLTSEFNWSVSSEAQRSIISMKEDGSDVQKATLELPEIMMKGDPAGNGGTVEPVPLPMPRTEVMESAIITDSIMKPVDGVFEEWVDPGYSEYVNYYPFVMSDSGCLFGICRYTYENYADPANYIYEQQTFLLCWGLDGKILWQKEMNFPGTDVYVEELVAAKDGGVYVVYRGDGYFSLKMDKNGEAAGTGVKLEIEDGWIERQSMCCEGNDETWLYTFYDEAFRTMQGVKVDLKTGTATQPANIPSSMYMGGWECFVPGTDYDFIFSCYRGIFGFNLGDAEVTKLMDYVNSDFAVGSVYYVLPMSAGRMFALYMDTSYQGMEASVLTPVAPEDVPDKQILTLAGIYLGAELRNDIIKFNKSNSEYRILMNDYSEYNTEEDQEIGKTRLNSDIIAGKVPDILFLGSELSADTYINKGLAADIGKLIEADEELSMDMFVENVIDTYSVNGVLYQIIPRFYVRTYLTHGGVVGDIDEMTFAKMKELQERFPDSSIYSYATRSSFLQDVMTFAGTDFVDAETGKCNFNNADFIEMLKFAKELPEEISFDSDAYIDYDYAAQFMDGKVLLFDAYFNDFRMNFTLNGYLEGKARYSGFPGVSGSRSVMQTSDAFLISSKSDYIDGAWQFLRKYLTAEYQTDMNFGLPTNKEAFEAKSLLALEKEYYIDEFGEKVEQNTTIYVKGEERVLPELSREQLDEMIDFIKSVDRVSYYNQEILNIVTEEAAVFFENKKSAEEVAGIIQNRVQLFVDENN